MCCVIGRIGCPPQMAQRVLFRFSTRRTAHWVYLTTIEKSLSWAAAFEVHYYCGAIAVTHSPIQSSSLLKLVLVGGGNTDCELNPVLFLSASPCVFNSHFSGSGEASTKWYSTEPMVHHLMLVVVVIVISSPSHPPDGIPSQSNKQFINFNLIHKRRGATRSSTPADRAQTICNYN